MLWVTQHLQHVRVSEASWRIHLSLSLSLSHQSDESYRRGVHINRWSSHSLSVIFIHNPNRISILTSEFPPLLKQVDLLSVVLRTWIFNPRVVYTRPGYHGNGYERTSKLGYRYRFFHFLNWPLAVFTTYFHFCIFIHVSLPIFLWHCFIKPRILFFKTTTHCCQSKIWQI